MMNAENNEENENSNNDFKISLDPSLVEKIGKIYQNFVNDSEIDRVLSRYKNDIDLIYDSFQTVLKNEFELYEKLVTSRKELNEINLKYSQAIKLSSLDNKSKSDILDEIEKAWHQTSLAKSKEKRAVETVNSLKLEIFNLSKLVEQGVGLTMGQEYNLREIIKEKESILTENTKLNQEMEELKSEMDILSKKDAEYNKQIEECKVQVSNANQTLLGCRLEIQKLTRKNEQLEQEIDSQKKICDSKESNLVKTNQTCQSLKQEILKLETGLRESQNSMDKNKKEIEIQNLRYQKLQNDFDQLYIKMDSLSMENNQLVQQLKRKDELIETQKFENIQTQKMRDAFEKKIKLLEDQKKELSNDKLVMENQIDKLNKLNNELEKDREAKEKQAEILNNEKDQVYLELKGSKLESRNYLDQIKILKNDLKSLQNEYSNFKTNNEKQDKVIKSFEKEKIKHLESLNNFQQKINSLNENVKLKELEIYDNKRKYSMLESKFKNIKRLYEATRADRNFYSKNFLKSKDDIKEIESKLETFLKQEIDFKNSIEKKEVYLNNLKIDNLVYKKNTENLVSKLDKNEEYLNNIKSKIKLSQVTEQNFIRIIENLECDCQKLAKINTRKEFEKNILGSQLIRRNDEISLLYEKIKLYEKILKRGEICYQKLVDELKMARTELIVVKNQNNILKKDGKMIDVLKKDLFICDKELMLEKAKRTAFENFQKSAIIHRWRNLREYDPSSYELILKVSILQKKLIFKTEQLASLELRLSEKDRLFLEMKKYFSRRILSDDETKMIKNYKSILSNISRKSKALLAENMMTSKLNEKLKSELEKASEEIKNFALKSNQMI